MASLVFASKRAGAVNEKQATFLWHQFNIHRIKLREPPELDFERETQHTVSDLVALHMNDLGNSLTDLARMLMMNDRELARTYTIDDKAKSAHLRIVR